MILVIVLAMALSSVFTNTKKEQSQSIAQKTTTTSSPFKTDFTNKQPQSYDTTKDKIIASTSSGTYITSSGKEVGKESVPTPTVKRHSGGGSSSSVPVTSVFNTSPQSVQPQQSVAPKIITPTPAPVSRGSVFDTISRAGTDNRQSIDTTLQDRNLNRKIAEYNSTVERFRKESALTRDNAFEKELQKQKQVLMSEIDTRSNVSKSKGTYFFDSSPELKVSSIKDIDKNKDISIVQKTTTTIPVKQKAFEVVKERGPEIRSKEAIETEKKEELAQKEFDRLVAESNKGITGRTLMGDLSREALVRQKLEKKGMDVTNLKSSISDKDLLQYKDIDKFVIVQGIGGVSLKGKNEAIAPTEKVIGNAKEYLSEQTKPKEVTKAFSFFEQKPENMSYINRPESEQSRISERKYSQLLTPVQGSNVARGEKIIQEMNSIKSNIDKINIETATPSEIARYNALVIDYNKLSSAYKEIYRPRAVLGVAPETKIDKNILQKMDDAISETQRKAVKASYQGGTKNTLFAASVSVPLTGYYGTKTVVTGITGLAVGAVGLAASGIVGGAKTVKSIATKGIVETGKDIGTKAGAGLVTAGTVISNFLGTGTLKGVTQQDRAYTKYVMMRPFEATGEVTGTLAPFGISYMSDLQKGINKALAPVGKETQLGSRTYTDKTATNIVEKFKYKNAGGEELIRITKKIIPKGQTTGKIEQTIKKGSELLDYSSADLSRVTKIEPKSPFKYSFEISEKYKLPFEKKVKYKTTGTIDVISEVQKSGQVGLSYSFEGLNMRDTAAKRILYGDIGEGIVDDVTKGLVKGKYQKGGFSSDKLLSSVRQIETSSSNIKKSLPKKGMFKSKKGSLGEVGFRASSDDDLVGRWNKIGTDTILEEPQVRTITRVEPKVSPIVKTTVKKITTNLATTLPGFSKATIYKPATLGNILSKASLIGQTRNLGKVNTLSQYKYVTKTLTGVSNKTMTKSLSEFTSQAKPVSIGLPKTTTISLPRTKVESTTTKITTDVFKPNIPTYTPPSIPRFGGIPGFKGSFKQDQGNMNFNIGKRTRSKTKENYLTNMFEKLLGKRK